MTSEQRERLDDATRNGPHKFGCNALFYGQPTTACTCGRRQRQDDIRALLAAHDALQAQLAEARADIDGLAAQLDKVVSEKEQVERERDEARAEVERLKAEATRIAKAINAALGTLALDLQEAPIAIGAVVRARKAAEDSVAHWQAEHGRVVEALRAARAELDCPHGEGADPAFNYGHRCVMCDDNVDGNMVLRKRIDAALTPAPTGDGPQTGAPETQR